MTQPVDVRTLHFRYPNSETGETDNHAVRIQYADIVTVSQFLIDVQVAEDSPGALGVELRYMNLSSEVKKDKFTIDQSSIAGVIQIMDENSVVDGVSPTL